MISVYLMLPRYRRKKSVCAHTIFPNCSFLLFRLCVPATFNAMARLFIRLPDWLKTRAFARSANLSDYIRRLIINDINSPHPIKRIISIKKTESQ